MSARAAPPSSDVDAVAQRLPRLLSSVLSGTRITLIGVTLFFNGYRSGGPQSARQKAREAELH